MGEEEQEAAEAGWRVGPYSHLVSLRTPGNNQWVIPPSTARALAQALIRVANEAEGRPKKQCPNCGILDVVGTPEEWRCFGCGHTREEASEIVKEEIKAKQGELGV